jgi:predicted transposase YdaD
MVVLRESPWYQQILQEGLEQGLERGLEQGLELGQEQALRQSLIRILRHRFDTIPADITMALQSVRTPQLQMLLDVALDVSSLDEFRRRLSDGGIFFDSASAN